MRRLPSRCCASTTRARPFVRVLDHAPRVKDIVASNYAHLSAAANGRTIAVMSVVDNLNKGAAGGAVQWMNRLFGLPETAGLTAPAPAGPDHMNAEHQTNSANLAAPTASRRSTRSTRIEVVGAEGVWLHTRDGRKVLDLYGGHAVASLGYGHQGWTKALSDQAAQMNFQTNAVPMEVRARAAQKLLTFSKLPFDSVFWINSGAEANENAFKMAFKMRPGRTHVAAVEQSFHGRTAACASTTWQAPQKWFFLPRAPFDVSWIKRRDVADIANHVTENTAAVIVEPVQGVGGAFDMGQEFLAALRKRCDETGALLIFDEVQCGVGRTRHAVRG